MNSRPLLSIIIPNYNNERYLGECLESINAQSYPNYEAIVVDDCSSDRSVELITAASRRNPSIRLLRNEQNMGVARTRHRGFLAARGSLVTNIDSDDYYLDRHKLSREVALVCAAPDWKRAIGYSNIVHVSAAGRPDRRAMRWPAVVRGNCLEDILTRRLPVPRDFVFSRDLYVRVGGFSFDLPIYEDWDLKIKLARHAAFYYTGLLGVAYRLHGAGLSAVKRSVALDWMETVFDRNTKDHPDARRLKKKLMAGQQPDDILTGAWLKLSRAVDRRYLRARSGRS